MTAAGAVAAYVITVLVIFGGIKLDVWLKKRAARKRVEAARRIVAFEEALFQENLKNLWQKPELEDLPSGTGGKFTEWPLNKTNDDETQQS